MQEYKYWEAMNGTVIDDRKKIHTELGHFAHALLFPLNKNKTHGRAGYMSKTSVAPPDPSIDHRTYLSISLHAFIPPLYSCDNKGKPVGLISFVNCEKISLTLQNHPRIPGVAS